MSLGVMFVILVMFANEQNFISLEVSYLAKRENIPDFIV